MEGIKVKKDIIKFLERELENVRNMDEEKFEDLENEEVIQIADDLFEVSECIIEDRPEDILGY